MFDTIKNRLEHWLSMREMERKGQLGTRKRRTGTPLADAADHSNVFAIFMMMLLWVLCSVLLMLSAHDRINLEWDHLSRAPHPVFVTTSTFEYEDHEATRAKIDEAVRNEPVMLVPLPDAKEAIEERFWNFFCALSDPEAARHYQIDDTLKQLCLNFLGQDDSYKEFIRLVERTGVLPAAELGNLKADTQLRIESLDMSHHRLAQNLMTPEQAGRELAYRLLSRVELPQDSDRETLARELGSIFARLIGPAGNLQIDTAATAKLREEAVARVNPVWRSLERGALIVKGGALLTPADRDCLAQYQEFYNANIESVSLNRELFINMAFSLFLVLFVVLYLYHLHPEVIHSNRLIFLFGTIVAVSLLINFAYIQLFHLASSQFGISPRLVYSVVPILLATVLLAVTMGLRVSMGGGFFVAVITAQMLRMSLVQALTAMLICSFAGLVVRRATNYRSLFLRTFMLLLLFWVLDGDVIKNLLDHREDIHQLVIVAGISTVSAAMLVLPLIFILELLFNVSTNMSLLVLCDFNHPLLKEMHLRAPGTSMHSQNVAILAENAAKAIDANPLRARAAALYHDIGKLVNPEYFTENNIGTANQHLNLSPRMSSIIIMNHVKDGLDMALKYKLPKVIRDAIIQHHGNSLLHFFHAAKAAGDEGAVEKDFRYPGPRPREPEIAIVSLADACEAYCRSLEKPTPARIEAAVDEIFRERIRNHQLDDAQITVADLAKVRDSFVWTLTTMYHGRIAYKKTEEEHESNLPLEKPSPAPAQPDATDPAGPKGD